MNLVPVTGPESQIVDRVQTEARTVTNRLLIEQRLAEAVHHLGNQLLDLIAEEKRNHREGSDVHAKLCAALEELDVAERLIRLRLEVNGR